jgi:pyruvate/oxaloacetate carboxyltransferase
MTVQEMHYEFKLGLDKVDSLSTPNFIPEEIDVILNNAQEEFITQRAYRNNPRQQGVEETQKRVDDLKNIISDYKTSTFSTTADNKPNGIFVNLPVDYRHALQEEVQLTYTNCNNQTTTSIAAIKPITHDRYNKLIRDPFNKPDKQFVFRLALEKTLTNERFELISSETISSYNLRYIRQPQRIQYGTQYQVPTTDQDCELSDYTHREIISIAVKNTLEDIESPRYNTTKNELNTIE